jgi:putative PIN family toxin of toxin-antitoxin system
VKVALDTNVIVSGLLTPYGNCGQILDLLIDGLFTACADLRILEEYETVLRREELDLRPGDIEEVLRFLRDAAELVAARPLAARLPDPDDLAFLEVAATAGALLVTGNKRHFPPRERHGVTVLAPREFLDLLAAAGPDAPTR